MRETLQRMEYFETYYYANVILNILRNPTPYLRNLNDWYEERKASLFLAPFPKWSVLHDFANFIIDGLIDESLRETAEAVAAGKNGEIWADRALRHHGFETVGFRKWMIEQGCRLSDACEDDVNEYHWELRNSGELDELLDHLANEAFFLLFGNRSALALLNDYAARIVADMALEDLPEEDRLKMKRDGVLKRVNIPEWVKRAVFFRDRGMCATCNTNVSGLVMVQNDRHFDHIIPLAVGGINDVTNIQLLCGACNLDKGASSRAPSTRYEAWYT